MKSVLILVVVLAIAGWALWRLEYLPGQDSGQYKAFQEFGTAIARGDIVTMTRLSAQDTTKEFASKTSLRMRSILRDVHKTAYRLDSEILSADGKQATLTVSQQLTADPVGVTSAFGTVTCQGRYDVTMESTGGDWRVSSLTVKSSDSRPRMPRFTISFAKTDAEWPCADSPWTTFAQSWTERVLGAR